MDQIWLKAVQAGMSRDALLADIPMRVQKEGHTASIGDSDISLNNLAGLLKGTNRSGEAEPLVRRALAIDEEALRTKFYKTTPQGREVVRKQAMRLGKAARRPD